MKPEKSLAPALAPISVLRMLWRRKVLIVAVTAVAYAGVFVAVRRMPAIYRAEAVVLVSSQKIPEKFVSSTVNADVQERLASINQQIFTSAPLLKIINDFGLYREYRDTRFVEEILEMMRKDISIKVEKAAVNSRPGGFRVAYEGKDPGVVAQVANRLAYLYIDENLKTREGQAEGTSEFIDTQLQDAKKQLDTLEAAVSKYKVEHNGSLPQQESVLGASLSRLQVELEANRDALNRAQEAKLIMENTVVSLQSTISAMTRKPDEPAPDSRQAAAPSAPRAAAAQPTAEETLVNNLRILRMRYTDDHPDVVRLKNEIARLRLASAAAAEQQKRTETANTAGKQPVEQPAAAWETGAAEPERDRAEVRQARQQLSMVQAQLAAEAKEIEARKAEQDRIRKNITEYEARISRLPLREQEMASLTRDYEISKANYRSLLDKKFAAGMASNMEHRQQAERFEVIDPARVPEKPIRPNRLLLNATGGVIAFVVGLALGLGLELRQGFLMGEWELAPGTVVLARLPHFGVANAGGGNPRIRRAIRNLVSTRSVRLALVSSGLLSILAAMLAGAYFIVGRF